MSTEEVEAKLSERKTVHEWLSANGIPSEEMGKPICLLRRLRITLDEYAEMRSRVDVLRAADHGRSKDRLADAAMWREERDALKKRLEAAHDALNRMYHTTGCTTIQMEIIRDVLPDDSCVSDDGDDMCDKCNCWKATRANCS